MPLVIASLPKFDQQSVNNVLLSLVAGCYTASLLNLWLGYSAYTDSGDINDVLYGELAHFHHPTYASMYLCLALSIAVYFLVHHNHKLGVAVRVVLLTSLPLFIIMIVMLMAKTGVLVLGVIVVLTFLYLLFTRRIVQTVVLTIIIGIGAGTTMQLMPDAFKRFKATWVVATQSEKERDITTIESTAGRIMVWEQATELLKEHWIFGVGTGDIKDELVARYRANGLTGIQEKKLNAHNQFLQSFCALGILGFLTLALGLLLPAISAIRTHNIIQFLFILIIVVNALTESILEVQAGVIFYAFFNSFFMFLNPISIRKNIP
jgi:O-antigen ligase